MTDPMPRKDVELPPRMPEAATIAELQRALLDARAERDRLRADAQAANGVWQANLRLQAELAAAQQREAGLLEALTPSGDTKAAYMFEIQDPDTKRMVSWTAIKMVMAMVSARAALSHGGRTQPTEYEQKVAQMREDFPNGI